MLRKRLDGMKPNQVLLNHILEEINFLIVKKDFWIKG
jgi:hypothetical protein